MRVLTNHENKEWRRNVLREDEGGLREIDAMRVKGREGRGSCGEVLKVHKFGEEVTMVELFEDDCNRPLLGWMSV